MLFKRNPNGIDLPFPSEITPRAVFEARRDFIKQAAVGAIAGPGILLAGEAGAQALAKLPATPNAHFVVPDKHTDFKYASTYNNFYEFGTDKDEPAQNAGSLRTRPWTVQVEGEVLKPATFDIDSLLKMAPLEERVYRLRCVEGWSMVIPWIGFPLAELIKRVQPTGNAKFVEFISLADKRQMPGVGSRVLNWPYTEGLRIDEANHPLTLLTMGMYGQVCRTRTARRCASSCPGSTVSSRPSRS
jgi:sulfoxide reductase catalytic subunit YedY